MRNLEHDIHGFLGLASDLSARIAAVGEGDIPTEWTPEHVGARMVEAFEILSRSGGRVGPGKFGNAWPEMLIEFADRTDAQARALAEKEWQETRGSVPSSDEVSRMNEALRWPMDHINGMVLASDALMLWAYAKATGRDMDGMLHQRKKRATALASEMMHRANADPHLDPDGVMRETRSPEVLARNALRKQIAVEIVDALNTRLPLVPKAEHPALIKAAHEALRNRCKAEGCLPTLYRPRDAIPGRVMARTTLDRQRKIAAAAIAVGLRRQGVAVR
jgi:hypothetical protein